MMGYKHTVENTCTESAFGREAHHFFSRVQDEIVAGLTEEDGRTRFRSDTWTRKGGGGGKTCVATQGAVIEKGGVNVSCVFGELPEAFAKEIPGAGRGFFATGVSLVIHPCSPRVPTVHANFRYLEKRTDDAKVAWFGGGADLTPWLLRPEDAEHFHQTWKDACDRHPVADYRAFKKACDEYFYLPHRGETRGIGGIFFDYLGLEDNQPIEDVFAFVQDAARSFLKSYLPIVTRRKEEAYSEEERAWQLLRRGRYVEFNLLYDRGTVFGLKTKGRTESILMSLPNLVSWGYAQEPQAGTYQQALVDVLKTPVDWLAPKK